MSVKSPPKSRLLDTGSYAKTLLALGLLNVLIGHCEHQWWLLGQAEPSGITNRRWELRNRDGGWGTETTIIWHVQQEAIHRCAAWKGVGWECLSRCGPAPEMLINYLQKMFYCSMNFLLCFNIHIEKNTLVNKTHLSCWVSFPYILSVFKIKLGE